MRAVGVNKLNSLMKTMAAKAGIENSRLRNHSGRKTMVQTLCEQDVPSTQIAQLSGHKNLKSIENYSSVSTRQQMYMSNVLSSLVAGTSSSSVEETCASTSCDSTAGKHAMSLFDGAVIQGGNFSININSLNQSPTQLAHDVIPTLAERRIYVSRDLTLIQRSHHVVFFT